eukprot:3069071-Pleurochrysis_carterae.AAC.3
MPFSGARGEHLDCRLSDRGDTKHAALRVAHGLGAPTRFAMHRQTAQCSRYCLFLLLRDGLDARSPRILVQRRMPTRAHSHACARADRLLHSMPMPRIGTKEAQNLMIEPA